METDSWASHHLEGGRKLGECDIPQEEEVICSFQRQREVKSDVPRELVIRSGQVEATDTCDYSRFHGGTRSKV